MTATTDPTDDDRTPDDVMGDIVVGVDGSNESFAALKWALHEADRTGQRINVVFGWTSSWDVGNEPNSDEAWKKVRKEITETLRSWVDEATQGIDFDPSLLTLTSVKASGPSALLQIGANAQQIVVGRRAMGKVARWFFGSLSASLVEDAKVPVTVVRGVREAAETSVQQDIARALSHVDAEAAPPKPPKPVVVGIDGSRGAHKALDFAVHEALANDRTLQVLFCWQMRDLGKVPGYEGAIPSVEAGQRRAEEILRDVIERASLPDGLDVQAHAFHIPAGKGLVSASRYADRVIVGSRGLSGMDAHFLGSVSKQVLDNAECTITVVH